MKLWNLYPIDSQSGPWDPWYDKAFCFVVRAETELEARSLAEDESGDESNNELFGEGQPNVWLDPELTACIELSADNGTDRVICRDFHSA